MVSRSGAEAVLQNTWNVYLACLHIEMPVVSPKACSQFNVHNMGAACCDGPDACKRSNFQFNGENKCGFADVCCRGTRTCEDGIFTGVRSMACSGSHACFNATVRMTGFVRHYKQCRRPFGFHLDDGRQPLHPNLRPWCKPAGSQHLDIRTVQQHPNGLHRWHL